MIKYSPRLVRQCGCWDDPAPGGDSWLCCSGVDLEWRAGYPLALWVGISDKPVNGAMEIRIVHRSDSFVSVLSPIHSFPDREFVSFCAYTPFKRFLLSLNAPTVWLWIEVPG